MLTLMLVGALCTASGDRICTYMDATQALHVVSDAHCFEMAEVANARSRETGAEARYACISPKRYAELSGEQAPTLGAREFL